MSRAAYEDEIIISWIELHRDARYLSGPLHKMGDWKGIIAVTRGGLVPAGLVARELDLRLVDTICIVSVKVVEWSDEDRCFVGSAPPLVGHSCHGATEASVIRQLRVIVDDVVETLLKHGDPLPAPSAGKKYSGNFVVRLARALHQKAALKAQARGESLNQFVAEALARA